MKTFKQFCEMHNPWEHTHHSLVAGDRVVATKHSDGGTGEIKVKPGHKGSYVASYQGIDGPVHEIKWDHIPQHVHDENPFAHHEHEFSRHNSGSHGGAG